MSRRTIAIMQPTYLPWVGYFDMIDRSDEFVFLDSVQFSKRSWQQRNRLKAVGQIQWLTVPSLSRGRREQRICEVEIDPTANFAEGHLKTITFLYRKAAHFSDYFEGLATVFGRGHRLLADLNIELIQWLCAQFGIDTPLLRSSHLQVAGKKTDLLVAICKAREAGGYLSAEGSRDYIEENNLFAANGIELGYHNYHHPEYRQLYGDFEPYLSALDLLFNVGPKSLAVIRSGRG